MNISSSMPRLKGYRFPREIVAYDIWVYHRFALGTADAEDLLAARGVVVSRDTIRKWVNRFGRHFANCITRDRPGAVEKWRLDEVVPPINGRKYGYGGRPTRKREKLTGRFKSPRQAQRCLATHDQINTIFRPRRYQLPAISYHPARADAFELWRGFVAERTD